MATTLTTPVIDGSALDGVSVQLTNLIDEHAVSWDMRYDTSSNLNNAAVNIVTPNANGVVEVSGLNATTNYYFQVRAVGDGTNYLTSAWSNYVQATTLNPTSAGSYDLFRIQQSMFPSNIVVGGKPIAFLARIQNVENENVIDPQLIDSAVFSLYKNDTAVTGFSGLSIPNDCFKTSIVTNHNIWSVDNNGFNFCYVPNQRSHWIFNETGSYTAEIILQIDGHNPIKLKYSINVIGG